MIDTIEARSFQVGDLAALNPQPSQRDWAGHSVEFEEGMANSATMFTWIREGDVIAVGGVTPTDRGLLAMVVLSEAARRYRKIIVGDTSLFLDTVDRLDMGDVWTHTDIGNEEQERLVKYLGFKEVRPETVHGREMMLWERG